MSGIRASFRTIPGTYAAVGRSGNQTVVVDRPEGVAGGRGLGFNGGQLLAMAIGGCLCNDLRYVAHDWGVELDDVMVDVSVDLEDGVVVAATVQIGVSSPKSVATRALAERAVEISTVLGAVRSGFDVDVQIDSD
jgi:organic hydroperoxide reductase OsmC/OhrA